MGTGTSKESAHLSRQQLSSQIKRQEAGCPDLGRGLWSHKMPDSVLEPPLRSSGTVGGLPDLGEPPIHVGTGPLQGYSEDSAGSVKDGVQSWCVEPLYTFRPRGSGKPLEGQDAGWGWPASRAENRAGASWMLSEN